MCIRTDISLSLVLPKINSEWIKDLNTRPEILKLLEDQIGKGKDFLIRTPVAQEIMSITDKWDRKKFKRFHKVQETTA